MHAKASRHAALPQASHDEAARQDFVLSLRQHLTRVTGPNAIATYKARLEPGFIERNGRAPSSVSEVRHLMTADPVYQFWSASQRASQELIWDSVIDTVERYTSDIPETGPQRKGGLELDPDLQMPRYNSVYDIHLQPGGYHSESGQNDLSAGAIYDLGVPIYGMGGMGPENDFAGQTIVQYTCRRFPNLKVERILDLGCAIGNSTIPWARRFPDADVHGIDVAAPCLRYGYRRANALGETIFFHQQNAEDLRFDDDSFDIVASSLLFHETSSSAIGRILREIRRVLKPGGVMVHLDGFNTGDDDPLTNFIYLWEAYNNNERFLMTLRSMDVVGLCKELGFRDVDLEIVCFGPEATHTDEMAEGYTSGFIGVPLLVARR